MVHEQVRKHISSGWSDEEWQWVALSHPVARLYLAGRRDDAHKLLREFTAAHEAGHALLGLRVGLDVRRVVVAHLHEVGQAGTLGYTEYRSTLGRRGGNDPVGEALHCLAGIAGHGLVYGDEWCLDQAAWTPAGELPSLRGEEGAGGDAWEARELIRPVILRGERFLGQSTVGGAMVAAIEQAEALLLPMHGALLELAGHLLAYGQADRSVIDAIAGRQR